MSDGLIATEFAYRASEPEAMHYRELDDNAGAVLEGRMMPYGEWTEIRSRLEGHFLERFAPGSLAKTIAERGKRIRVLFEHGQDFLGRQPIATFDEFRDEDDGAYFSASLLRGLPDLLIEGIRRGVYGSSIRFKPVPGKFDRVVGPKPSEHNPKGLDEVTHREAYMHEFSVVTFPQYEGATAGIRSLTDEVAARALRLDTLAFELATDVRERLASDEASPEPPHSNDDPDEDADQTSRSTPTGRDYLQPEKGEPAWLL